MVGMPDTKDEIRLINNVACFGFADAKEADPLYKEAFEVART